MTVLPRVLVVNREIGVSSQPWFWRRVVGYRGMVPVVLTWTRHDGGALDADGIEIHRLDTPPEPNQLPPRSRWAHRLRCLPSGNFFASIGQERRTIERWARSRDVVAMLTHFGPTSLRMLPIARRLGIPQVAHFHGFDVSSSLRNPWYRRSLIPALRRFQACVCVGSHQRRWLIEHGVPAERCHLIPSGVPCADFKPRTHHASEAVRFIAVSRLIEGKGLEYTLQAFAQVLGQRPQARLLLAGDGPLRSSLERCALELGIADAVDFLGAVAWNEMPALMSSADVFVQHSLTARSGWVEGFGVSIAEAAATALPVVVTRSGGIMDQVLEDRTGLVVAERDVAGMAEAMLRLAQDVTLREDLGRAGHAHVSANFDTRLMIERLEAVVLSTLGN